MTFVFLPVIWYVTDRIIEPRLGTFDPSLAAATGADDDSNRELTEAERKGLKNAGWAVLFVIALWTYFTIGPGTPLINESASAEAQMAPFYKSLVAAFFVMFLWLDGTTGRPQARLTIIVIL